LPAFNASLFLSANEDDIQKAIDSNYPAGVVLPSKVYDDELDNEWCVAFVIPAGKPESKAMDGICQMSCRST
jgi:hypothetical protein